jgi:hypothetical protein
MAAAGACVMWVLLRWNVWGFFREGSCCGEGLFITTMVSNIIACYSSWSSSILTRRRVHCGSPIHGTRVVDDGKLAWLAR